MGVIDDLYHILPHFSKVWLLSLSQVVFDDKVAPHFLVAKYFLPLIQDTEGTSFTIINGMLPELY